MTARVLLLTASLHAVLWLGGCTTDKPRDVVLGPSFTPANIHRLAPTLPTEVRRVAVLPVNTPGLATALGAAAREALEPVFREELAKTRRFELVTVSAERLQQRTGRAGWSSDDPLPVEFFDFLREAYGCDAVLFPQVTVYRAYPPLAIGWRLTLVEAQKRQILWAADEVFDAGESAVINGARRYQQSQQQPAGPVDDSHAILNSPRRFGHYSAATLLGTLPGR